MTKKSPMTVAKYLADRIPACGKTNAEIALAMGYTQDRANYVSMMRLGRSKVPINKIGVLAKALDEDPVFLLKLVLGEYSPDTAAVINDILETRVGAGMEAGERAVLQVVRNKAGGFPLELNADELATIESVVGIAMKRTKAHYDKEKKFDQSKKAWVTLPGKMQPA